jgi:hypothetical protein
MPASSTWIELDFGVFEHEERGPAVNKEANVRVDDDYQARARKMIRELRSLGYGVELASHPP